MVPVGTAHYKWFIEMNLKQNFPNPNKQIEVTSASFDIGTASAQDTAYNTAGTLIEGFELGLFPTHLFDTQIPTTTNVS